MSKAMVVSLCTGNQVVISKQKLAKGLSDNGITFQFDGEKAILIVTAS